MALPARSPAVERRGEARYDVALPGELIWNNGAKRQRCTIRDISENGARIHTGFFVDVPEKVFLLEVDSRNLFECQVRWHMSAELGLFFVDLASLSARRLLIQKHAGPQ
jgi:methyl-accepting chemotaxis protein